MKRPNHKPPFKGLTSEQYSRTQDILGTMFKLDIVDAADTQHFVIFMRIKSPRADIDWYTEHREKSMPWLKNPKRKSYQR